MIESSDRSMHPEYHSEQESLRNALEHAIASLSMEIREPFMLHEFEGFSYKEIADQLAITLGATRQRIYRAKQELREMLIPEFEQGTRNTDRDEAFKRIG